MKIYIVTGVSIGIDEENRFSNHMSCTMGYYTNLKELYKNFEQGSIQSYSTICSRIKANGFYVTKNSRFWHYYSYETFNELIIRQVLTNTLYKNNKEFSLTELLSKEVGSIDIHLGVNLSSKKHR